MIIVRSERRLPPTKGISEYPRMGSSLARRVIQVRVVLGYVSVEAWDPTRRVFPLQQKEAPQNEISCAANSPDAHPQISAEIPWRVLVSGPYWCMMGQTRERTFLRNSTE